MKKAMEILQQLDGLKTQRYVSPFYFGMVYLGLDNHDEAYTWFNQAYFEHDFHMRWIWCWFYFWEETTQQDPRYRDLLEKMGMGHLEPRTYPLLPQYNK